MTRGRCCLLSGAVLLVGLMGCAPNAPPRWTLERDSVRACQLNERGLACIERGRAAEAEEHFRRALEADAYFGPAHCNLGVVLLQKGQLYEAGWQLRHACQLMPKASQPRANLGILYATVGRYEPAERQLRSALRLAPADVEIIGHLARINVRRGRRDAETLAWLHTVATQDNNPKWQAWAGRELVNFETSNSHREDQR